MLLLFVSHWAKVQLPGVLALAVVQRSMQYSRELTKLVVEVTVPARGDMKQAIS